VLCCQGYPFVDGGETAFEIDAARVIYGAGALRDAGALAHELGLRRVALFTDSTLARLEPVAIAERSLHEAGIDCARYDAVRIEPTNVSFADATAFARDGAFDGFVSVGGGSVIDTCKAANLYSTYPDDFAAYVNAPLGGAKPVPGPLRPHIACPTTAGTGSEVTGLAIFDYLEHRAKTGIASKRLRPTVAVVDPECTATLPKNVIACAGFDVLSHALESYTARPFTRRPKPSAPSARPMSQGANPFSDIAAAQALRILGEAIVRAVNDERDYAARERMMYAATLAGIGFGNAGVHVPHAMAYAVGGLAQAYVANDYPAAHPLVPHGMAVIVNTPAVVRFTATGDPQRHLDAAAMLGADVRDAGPADAGEVLALRIEALMRATAMPNGIGGVSLGTSDIAGLRDGAAAQKRLLANAPRVTGETELEDLFARALHYW
jgi:hydroxyacid-oxoacid transhydrogenase